MMTDFNTRLILTASALSVLAFATPAAMADVPIYQYEDGNGKLFLTNIQQNTGGAAKFTQKSVTYYPDTKLHSNGDIPSTYNPTTAATPSRSANRNAYDHLIRAASARHGVDAALIKAIIHTESAFNPSARSPVGAMGLMQLMPGTARDMGVMNAWDPVQNIEGGTKYLAWLMRQFNNRDYVVAAYNAGLGNVRKHGGIPPFRETQNYVKSVNSRYASLYRNDAGISGAYIAQNHNAPAVQQVSMASYNNTSQNSNYATPQNNQTATISSSSGRIYISSSGNNR
ncbi:MAG: lytic transglycosylase domain-containing protein [Moraxella sp.]|nr:lytic transglycosylase domain-containing protein [Moraxella sp.]